MKSTVEKNARDFLMSIQRTKSLKDAQSGLIDASLMERKNVLDLNIAVGVDVSGSISSYQFAQFMAQLDAIRGLSRVKVLETDTDIVAMYDYFITPRSKVVRAGGQGGTEFSKVFKVLKDLKPDAILFMTDGDVAGHVNDPGIPVGWVMTGNQRPPFSFGKVIVQLGSSSRYTY